MRNAAFVLALVMVRLATPSLAAAQAAADSSESIGWEYNAFATVGYLRDVLDPHNRVWRSRGTTWRLNALQLDMLAAHVRKETSRQSRWGAELLVQAGRDAELFGFSATAPNIAGAKLFRHLGPANVSYLAPVGTGLALQGGIFTSLIGYDSLYAKDNLSYTRPWGADFTPYLMMGVNAAYPFTDRLSATFFVVNGYWHLANANRVPSSGVQFAYKPTPRITIKESVLSGPHQTNTSFKFWRHLSDTVVERRTRRAVVALNFNVASETIDSAIRRRAWWVSAQLPACRSLGDRWSVAVRPEIAWDSLGRWTLAEQTIKALTSTLVYARPKRRFQAIVQIDYRVDVSRGPGGGFFDGTRSDSGVARLKPVQHLAGAGLTLSFDSARAPSSTCGE